MARQDYAQKRRRTSSASRAPTKRQSTPAPRKKSWWPRALLAGAALFGLIYLLNVLIATGPSSIPEPRQQTAPQPAPVAPVVPEAPDAAPEPEVAPPPIAPEARFDFYDILPRSEVQGPEGVYHSTPKDAPEAQPRFLLQTGSFKNEADAERMRAELLLSGLPNVHTSRVDGDNGIWFRVRTGPFNTRTELNRAHNQLTSLGISPLRIPLN